MRLKSMFILLGSLVSSACNPNPDVQAPSPTPATWEDDMTYAYLDEDKRETKKILKIAKKYSAYKDYYPRYRLGNLAVIEASSPPPPLTKDAEGKHGMIGVLIGAEPRFVTFPDRALFAHFMHVTRHDPAAIRQDEASKDPMAFSLRMRLRMSLLLATGNDHYLQMDDFKNDTMRKTFEHADVTPHEPTWREEDGTLTIQYYKYQSRGMMAPIPVQCTIIVDDKQNYDYRCVDITDLPQNQEETDGSSQPPVLEDA